MGQDGQHMAATTEGNQLSREEQDRMCRNKRRYRRENDALMAVVQARSRFRDGAGRVYRCPVCSAWHITHGLKTS